MRAAYPASTQASFWLLNDGDQVSGTGGCEATARTGSAGLSGSLSSSQPGKPGTKKVDERVHFLSFSNF